MMVSIVRTQNGVRRILFPGHPEWVLAEALARLVAPINILPCLWIDAGYLVGANPDHLSISFVESLGIIYQSPALHCTHERPSCQDPELWAWKSCQRMVPKEVHGPCCNILGKLALPSYLITILTVVHAYRDQQ
jgi:hypothetical protein